MDKSGVLVPVEEGVGAILARHRERAREGALLVGISGIDGSGKSYLTRRMVEALVGRGIQAVGINVDGWLALPHVRFDPERLAEGFYEKALRLDEMFQRLILPLKRDGKVRVVADSAEETATSFRDYRYEYEAVRVILLEGTTCSSGSIATSSISGSGSTAASRRR